MRVGGGRIYSVEQGNKPEKKKKSVQLIEAWVSLGIPGRKRIHTEATETTTTTATSTTNERTRAAASAHPMKTPPSTTTEA